MPNKWLPLVWGTDDALFKNPSDLRTATNLIMPYYNDMVRILTPLRTDDEPLYDEETGTNEILPEP